MLNILHCPDVVYFQGYRFAILSMLPNLVKLDHNLATKGDKATAACYVSLGMGKTKKKPKKKEDDFMI